MKGEILGVERRRRWSDGEKLAILAAVGVKGATVTEVARRHEITRSQVFGWRRDLKRKRLLPAAAAGLGHPSAVRRALVRPASG